MCPPSLTSGPVGVDRAEKGRARPGSYQPLSGQTGCLACPPGMTCSRTDMRVSPGYYGFATAGAALEEESGKWSAHSLRATVSIVF